MGGLFFSAEGRIGQGPFWFGALVLWAAGAASSLLPFIAPVVLLLIFYSWICLVSKRLHDMGRSAWLQTLPVLFGWGLMLAGGWGGLVSLRRLVEGGELSALAGAALAGGAFALGAVIAGGLVHLLLLLWVGLAPGQSGFNRYGPPPGAADPAGRAPPP